MPRASRNLNPAQLPGVGSMKPYALLGLDFLTGAGSKCIRYSESPALVKRKGFIIPAPSGGATRGKVR